MGNIDLFKGHEGQMEGPEGHLIRGGKPPGLPKIEGVAALLIQRDLHHVDPRLPVPAEQGLVKGLAAGG